jgi:2,4-dienoyl-CoA reductase-like NADH-dependent reductase (Old Yellow Enzyme family)
VHSAGGRILLQLWHVGRVSDPIYLNGALPVAPSPIAPAGHVRLVRPERPFVTPRALEVEEIPGIIAEHKKAAGNAMNAGFDGVEIAGTNGYLLDQFQSCHFRFYKRHGYQHCSRYKNNPQATIFCASRLLLILENQWRHRK